MSGLELSRCSGKQTAEEVKAQQERLEEAHTAALEMMIAQHEEQKNEAIEVLISEQAAVQAGHQVRLLACCIVRYRFKTMTTTVTETAAATTTTTMMAT